MTQFLTVTRSVRRSANEISAVWCAASNIANPKDVDITAKSYSRAALTRIRRPRTVIGSDTPNSDLVLNGRKEAKRSSDVYLRRTHDTREVYLKLKT